MACEILVPRPGIKPTPLALEAQSLKHWTAREVSEGTCRPCEESGANPEGNSGAVTQSDLDFRWVTLAVACRVSWRRGGSKA